MREEYIVKRITTIRRKGPAMIARWIVNNERIERLIKSILKAINNTKPFPELYLVGGSVRDLIEGKQVIKDIDLMMTDITYEGLGEILSRIRHDRSLGIKEITSAGKSFPVYKISTNWFHNQIDIALARTEVSTGLGHKDFRIHTKDVQAKEDSGRRDFTINAIFYKFELNGSALGGSIIDYHNGIKDIACRRIKAVGSPDARFCEDPLRMLRAIRQKNQRRGFRVEEKTWNAIIRDMPILIKTISPERISEELVKSLLANPVKTYFDWKETGALREIIPEVDRLDKKAQNLMIRRYRYLFRYGVKNEINDILLISCLLLEPAVDEFNEQFLKKADNLPDYDLVEKTLSTLSVTEKISRRVVLPHIKEINNMLHSFILLINYKRLSNRRAAVEKVLLGNSLARQIVILYQAHQDADGQEKIDIDYLLEKFRSSPRLVSGKDIIDEGIAPGPHMGFILMSIRELELRDEISTRKEALKFAIQIYKNYRDRRSKE